MSCSSVWGSVVVTGQESLGQREPDDKRSRMSGRLSTIQWGLFPPIPIWDANCTQKGVSERFDSHQKGVSCSSRPDDSTIFPPPPKCRRDDRSRSWEARAGMSALFKPSANFFAKFSLVAVGLVAGGALLGLWGYWRTPYAQGLQEEIAQPVLFDHRHHVVDDVIDCRYCHFNGGAGASAGIPSTEMCLNCHSQVWNKSPKLEPVRRSYFTGDAHRVEPGPPAPRLRLLQPLDPREQGRRLRHLPRPRRPDGGGRPRCARSR